MKKQFNLSLVAVAAASLLGSASAMADYVDANSGARIINWNSVMYIIGNADNSNSADEGVFITSNSTNTANVDNIAVDRAYLQLLTSGVANFVGNTSVNITSPTTTINGALSVTGGSATTGITNTGNITNSGTLGVTGATTLDGATSINNTLNVTGLSTTAGVTNIGAMNNTGALTQSGGTANINTDGGATNIGNVTTSVNTINGASNAITGRTGNTMTATTGNNVIAATAGANNMTAFTANNIEAPINNIGVATTSSVNTIGNTNASTSVTSRGGNSSTVVKNNSAATTVTGLSASASSSLTGASQAVKAGSAVVLKGATDTTQTVVDANGKLSNVAVTSTATTQSTAALTLTNGVGNVHGVVVTESQTTLSGGTQSSSMTLNDRAATFSNAQTGAPITVTGVANGKDDFDAVNVRQFAGAIAAVTAAANIPAPDAGKSSAFGVGVGSFMGKSALSLGLVHRTEKGPMLKFSVSGGLNEGGQTPTIGAGAGWSW